MCSMNVVTVAISNTAMLSSRVFLPGVAIVFVGGNDPKTSRGKPRDAFAVATRGVLLPTCIGREACV